jgi:aspartate kinase
VALAAALDAAVCEIYTDVDGVFTADPRIVPAARHIPVITPEEMLEMAASGAKVLHVRCVEYARRYGVPLHVRSSFSTMMGTIVAEGTSRAFPVSPTELYTPPTHTEEPAMDTDASLEAPLISGVAHDRSQAKITVAGVPDIPGKAAAVFEVVAGAEANIDMIVQNVAPGQTGRTDISFTLPAADVAATVSALGAAQADLGYRELLADSKIGKLSLVGAGMRSHPGVSARLFSALSGAGVNIDMISTSEIRISVVTRADVLDDAVRAVNSAFDLDSTEGEAIVYGGSGR